MNPFHAFLDTDMVGRPEKANDLEGDSICVLKVCSVDARFRAEEWISEWNLVKRFAAALNSVKGRTIKYVDYSADPIGENNPMGHLGSIRLHLEPLPDSSDKPPPATTTEEGSGAGGGTSLGD